MQADGRVHHQLLLQLEGRVHHQLAAGRLHPQLVQADEDRRFHCQLLQAAGRVYNQLLQAEVRVHHQLR